MKEKKTILLTILYHNIEYPVQTNPGQYYSLMTLVADQLCVPGFGLCSGMGSCGTCMVEIQREHSQIKTFTLSCDVRIDDQLANAIVIVPDEFRY